MRLCRDWTQVAQRLVTMCSLKALQHFQPRGPGAEAGFDVDMPGAADALELGAPAI